MKILKLEVELNETTGWSVLIFAIATIIISCTYIGVKSSEATYAKAFENGYEQIVLPGSTLPRWIKNSDK